MPYNNSLVKTVWFQIADNNNNNNNNNNFEHLYLTHRWDFNSDYHSVSEWIWDLRQWKSTSHSPKLLDWQLTIRYASIIPKTVVLENVLLLHRELISVSYRPSRHIYIYIYIYIIIIIIMSCREQGYPWPSVATSPYHSSPPAGLQGYILCLHIAALCRFELVVLLLLGHMWGSIGVHHLRARPCFSSSVLRVWFV